MTYEELVQNIRDIYTNADAGNVKEHVAIQCNIEGEAEGALYIEFQREISMCSLMSIMTEMQF